jgi:hypothetical protein
MRQQPTWGDVNVLVSAIPRLGIHNDSTLLSAFGSSLYGPIHLQKVRNACAHINSETMNDLRSLAAYYVSRQLNHPTEVMWWSEPITRTDAIYIWMEDLESIADYAKYNKDFETDSPIVTVLASATPARTRANYGSRLKSLLY